MHNLYFEKEKKETPSPLTKQETEDRLNDTESVKNQKEYAESFHARMLQGGKIYNLIQEGQTDDRMSNVYLGLARIIMDQSIAQMSAGVPAFNFDPVGPTDYKKAVIWKALVEHVLSCNNFRSKFKQFIIDLHVFGSSVLEVGVQTPFRNCRKHQGNEYIRTVVRDFLKPRVFVRHRSIFGAYRNPTVEDPDDVPTGGYTEILTRDEFVTKFMNVTLPNGKPKYKNLNHIDRTSHYRVEHIFSEYADAYRIYVYGYGSKPDGKVEQDNNRELGIPIFDKPLKRSRHKMEVDGREIEVSTGVNLQGKIPLCFGQFADQMDADFKTHALFGMGIPQIIDGPEAIMQALFNMTVDNMVLKNTVPISYKSHSGDSYADTDNFSFYSGQFIDADISAHPLGVADLSGNSVMWDWINNLSMWLTKVNFMQLGGDTSNTAFELSQRIRANNQGAMERITSLENGCLKRFGELVLSSALMELTVHEWEALTEKDAEEIAKRIGDNDPNTTAEDYEMSEGKPVRRRRMEMIKIPGKYRENFSSSKTRKLDYNSTDNTLIRDDNLPGDSSFIPVIDKYVFPSGDIMSALKFDVRVDGKAALGDLRAQDSKTLSELLKIGVELRSAGLLTEEDVDIPKIYERFIEFSGVDPEDVRSSDDEGELMKKIKDTLSVMKNFSPSPNDVPQAPVSGSPVPAQPGLPAPQPTENPAPPNNLTAVASGTI